VETPPEQRILDAVAHLPEQGAVTGWAALRLWEAAYFDGLDAEMRERPVPLATGSTQGRRAVDGVSLNYERLPDDDVALIRGLRVTTPPRALFDELRSLDARSGVVAADMALAAHVVRLPEMCAYAAARIGWRRGSRAASALDRARPGVRSPRETLLRLVCTDDAGLPEPAVNAMVFDLDGRFVVCADLFDEGAGLVIEYDGDDHASKRRRARDARREEACRDLSLEYIRVVSPDLTDNPRLVRRLRAARARARFLPANERQWTTEWPPGWAPWW
jgi:hypothetical protein